MPASSPSSHSPTLPGLSPPTHADVIAAAGRLKGHAVVTPLLESPLLNDQLGGRLLVKAEVLQRTGSFKFRGAFNRISQIPEVERANGVVAFSSGNHAQGVAAAARMLGIKATIVMPSDAPAIKIANTRAWGAEVVLYDRWTEDREAIGARISSETGATLVRPYDDPHVMAGQGTIGLELADQADAAGATLDAVLAPCGGGGMISGIALALSGRLPETKIFAVEPEGFDDTRRSLVAGQRLANTPGASSFCDALLAATPGILTFAVNGEHLAGGFAVSDAEVGRAMAVARDHFKLVVEPGGAVALAAVIAGKVAIEGRTLAVVCSGGNVDPAVYQRALSEFGI
ncbi:serine/threonine dehydratase [Skermanella stibiiresistens SB22]|uniref:Serine/threonine dehydratase n=1 Tax=Skermanella stibiiresistens SB22 TaxID=1385369 RepID=W9H1Z1_9PROT|nr:threonine/serine dehydratase [Skermanella stibiiresistens]EWY40190.1 serine/threonine dehydratase [Skermanella stibiiresistens SB22]